MDTGNIISFLKKFSFGRLIGSGILLKVVIAIVDGIFALEINELPNFNFFIFGLAMAYTILWMFNNCLLYTSPSPRDLSTSRMPSSA